VKLNLLFIDKLDESFLQLPLFFVMDHKQYFDRVKIMEAVKFFFFVAILECSKAIYL